MAQKRQAEIQDGGWFHTVLIRFWPMSNTTGSQAAMLLRSSSTEPNRSSAWAVVRCCMYERFTSIVWQQQGHILSPNNGLQRVLIICARAALCALLVIKLLKIKLINYILVKLLMSEFISIPMKILMSSSHKINYNILLICAHKLP